MSSSFLGDRVDVFMKIPKLNFLNKEHTLNILATLTFAFISLMDFKYILPIFVLKTD